MFEELNIFQFVSHTATLLLCTKSKLITISVINYLNSRRNNQMIEQVVATNTVKPIDCLHFINGKYIPPTNGRVF